MYPGYTRFLKIENLPRGEGVAIFVLEALDCVVREEITIGEQICDCLFLNINLTDCVRKTVGVIYRLPGLNISSFVAALKPLLKHISDTKSECLITGDFSAIIN